MNDRHDDTGMSMRTVPGAAVKGYGCGPAPEPKHKLSVVLLDICVPASLGILSQTHCIMLSCQERVQTNEYIMKVILAVHLALKMSFLLRP